LGLKIQHALRGFTAKDRKEIDKAIENYPITEFYDASQLIQNLGIGEAFITALDEKGIPTPLVDTYLVSPESRMDVLNAAEVADLTSRSRLVSKYEENVDKESAYEILAQRMEQAVKKADPVVQKNQAGKGRTGNVRAGAYKQSRPHLYQYPDARRRKSRARNVRLGRQEKALNFV